ncbi:winged helix-turn-helix domain-containing protein [Streptomyces sp. NPDC015350]|uniref:winged helix-turn-helix domain-containing protein n=1 Tax=Streptomyces sp. NPDC015350 TaxID=3364955 RepID=UPI0036FA52F3
MWWPCEWEAAGVAYQPSPSIAGPSLPPLSRPRLAEARRVRTAELFEDGVSNAEIARAVGVCAESVRRWRRMVVTRATGVVLSRASVWRLLTGRLGRSLQRPERRAVERNESEIARWIAHEWPRIRKGP